MIQPSSECVCQHAAPVAMAEIEQMAALCMKDLDDDDIDDNDLNDEDLLVTKFNTIGLNSLIYLTDCRKCLILLILYIGRTK